MGKNSDSVLVGNYKQKSYQQKIRQINYS